jgi:glutaconate CoA-transferase subunit B
VDRYCNLNSTVIGDYAKPKVRLPGAGGATEIASSCGRIFVVMPHNARAFVPKLDFLTTLGHGRTGRERRQIGIPTSGPMLLVTDLCIMEPEPDTCEFVVTSLHPGVSRDQVRQNTGWEVRFADKIGETGEPSSHELDVLRALHARTARAHQNSAEALKEDGI